jgi:hypothetical protein
MLRVAGNRGINFRHLKGAAARLAPKMKKTYGLCASFLLKTE